jgi:multidrug resistance efflux pump
LDPWTRDGRVRADVVQVAPDVSGLVTDVLVHDNQGVKKGQALFVIDQPCVELALRQTEAAMAGAEAPVDEAVLEDTRNLKLGNLVSTEIIQQVGTRQAQAQAQAGLAQAMVAQTPRS